MSRFFVAPEDVGAEYITIENKEDLHHMNKVLRLKAGDEIDVSDGDMWEYHGKILSLEPECCQVEILDKQKFSAEPETKITLFQGIPKQGKMELIVQKAVECGACEVVPFISKRCVSRPDAKQLAKKTERWQRIAYEAAKQCGRGIIPQVGSTIDISKIPALISPENTGILFYECAETPLREAVGEFTRNIDIVIGSEGGFEQSEAEKLIAAGLKCASLGKRILRCETAPIAAISVLMNMTGNM